VTPQTLLLIALVLSGACRNKDDTAQETATVVDSEVVDDSTTHTGGTGLADADGDGFRVDEDCDDSNNTIHPDADERCDGVDNDCDDLVDEDDAVDGETWYLDADDDGYGGESTATACDQPEGYVSETGDCDDLDPAYHPSADEDDCTDPNDYNCDGSVGYEDLDDDGYAACAECDDQDPSVYPDAPETCNEVDDNCNGEVDEGVTSTFYQDGDDDGFGDPDSTTEACTAPPGYVTNTDDCHDSDGDIHPDADEVCDGEDNDCDRKIDEKDAIDPETWYLDSDLDGYGDPDSSSADCDAPSGYVADDTDCDDTDGAVNPGADEVCDDVDNDCDGDIDDDDSSLAGADTWNIDYDGDGYGSTSYTREACDQPSGYVADTTDCDDTDAASFPGADETCDEADNDCDGDVDEDTIDGDWYATDVDGDGFGDPGSTVWGCDGADNEYDCDDGDSNEPIVVDADKGSGAGNGSALMPYDSVQDGIDAATTCVIVFEGTYTEAIDFSGKDLEVIGLGGSEVTILDGTASGFPVVTAETAEANASLTGFTLTGGEGHLDETSETYECGSACTGTYTYSTYCGGGVYVSGSALTLEDVVVDTNALPENSETTTDYDIYYTYSFGGGLCASNATVEFSDGQIVDNHAYDGGGVYVYGSSVVDIARTSLLGNSAYDGGGMQIEGGLVTLTNAVSAWNSAEGSGGGVLITSGNLEEVNVTHAGDDAPVGGGLYADSSATVELNGVIVHGAATGEGILSASATWLIEYSDVYGNAGGEYSGLSDPTGTNGNLSEDPLFTAFTDDGDRTNDDLSLATGSPCIDAGDPDTSMDDADGTTNDQGAYGGPDSDWAD